MTPGTYTASSWRSEDRSTPTRTALNVGVRSNFVAAWHAARVMTRQRAGLIVAISGYVGVTFTYGAVFGTCKAAVDRMARDMAVELKPYNVASISLWQGLTFTERANRNLAQPHL